MSTFLTTIAHFQASGLDLDKNTRIEVLQPHIDASERNFLRPVLGEDFYLALEADLNTPNPTETTLALLPYLRKPIAWNAYYLFFKKPIGSISHSGFFKKSFDHAQQPAKWEIDSLKEELICTADRALDELIAFLRENSLDYELWQTSEYFEANKSRIIQNADQFDAYVKIGCSSRIFQRILHFRQRAELNVKRTVCSDLYALILDMLSGEETMTPAVEALLPYLRAMVAYDTMTQAILQVPFYRYGNDVMTWTYADGTLTKSGLSVSEARQLAETYKQFYEDARQDLLGFLQDNLDDYPEYASSSCYSDSPRTLEVRYENDISKKHFGI